MATPQSAQGSNAQGLNPYTPIAIVTPHTQLATNFDGIQMNVNACDRLRYQTLWLWVFGSDVSTNVRTYDPNLHSPAVTGPIHDLPTIEELTPVEGTLEYLEVGVVIGERPDLYKGLRAYDAGFPSEVIDLPRHPLRVFTLVTGQIVAKPTFYVGVLPVQGRRCLRQIDPGVVFFYFDFCVTIPPRPLKASRVVAINTRVRYHAAKNKVFQEHGITWYASDDLAGVQPAELPPATEEYVQPSIESVQEENGVSVAEIEEFVDHLEATGQLIITGEDITIPHHVRDQAVMSTYLGRLEELSKRLKNTLEERNVM